MSRNIVLLSDGTGNSAAKLFKTNVWRLYQALDVSNASQIAFYDDGVGTSIFRPLAVLGGIFGLGLKRNIIAMYMFLCRNYQPGDRIYAFGFSRGAFTIRVLTKFVMAKGLVNDFESIDDLNRKSTQLFRHFRRTEIRIFRTSSIVQSCLYSLLRPFEHKRIRTLPVREIQFLGLWDTVDAYRLPIEELKIGIDRFIWPLSFADRELSQGVQKACHALAMDDKRMTFHPLLWDESVPTDEQHTDSERLTQVWFAGAHSNVGGGYPDDGLSHISLRWMTFEAIKQGLRVNPRALDELSERVAPFGRIYDPRAGLGAYYRFGPRRLDPPIDKYGALIANTKIHESVINRVLHGTDAYAPLSIPGAFRIVVDDFAHASNKDAQREDFKNLYEPSEYEELLRADAGATGRMHQTIRVRVDALQDGPPNATTLMWATVWWRQVAYFLTLFVSACLIIYPLMKADINDFLFSLLLKVEQITNAFPLIVLARKVTETLAAVLEPGIAFILKVSISLLPSFAKPWLEIYLNSAWSVAVFSLLIALSLALGAVLDRRIHDRALAMWNKSWELNRSNWLRHRTSLRIAASCLLALLMVLFNYQLLTAYFNGDLELTDCRYTDGPDICLYDRTIRRRSGSSLDSSAMRGTTIFLSVLFGSVGMGAAFNAAMVYRNYKKLEHRGRELPSIALWIAIIAAKSSTLERVRVLLTRVLIPGVFTSFLVVATIAYLNQLIFAFLVGMGFICPSANREFVFVEYKGSQTIELNSGKQCSLLFGADYGQTYKVSARGLDSHRTFFRPFLRNPSAPRYATILRDRGDETILHSYNGEEISFRRGGQFSVYINDFIIASPYSWDIFYKLWPKTVDVTVDNVSTSEPEIPP